MTYFDDHILALYAPKRSDVISGFEFEHLMLLVRLLTPHIRVICQKISWRRPLPAKLGSSQAAMYVEETVEVGRVWLGSFQSPVVAAVGLRHKPLALQRLPLRCGKIRKILLDDMTDMDGYGWIWLMLMIVVLFAVDIVYTVRFVCLFVCLFFFGYDWPYTHR